MNFRILYFSLFLLLLSCEKYDDIAGYNEYVIKKGEHFSDGKSLGELTSTVLTYDVIFDQSAKYTLDAHNQKDVNKLFGFADCNSNHQENSARFGWRWYNNELQIFSFTHVEGKIDFEYLRTVEINKSFRYSIVVNEGNYEFRIDDLIKPHYFTRGKVCGVGYHYLLFPYFGGDQVAPKDISIFMKRIYK